MADSLSVVVPTYRRANELEELLFPSVKSQSVLPKEVIVVDDTEDDSVHRTCKAWNRAFIEAGCALRYIKPQGPRSISRARNIGSREALGDILLFLDSDIRLLPGYIEGITSIFRDYPSALGVQGMITNWADNPLARRFLRQYGNPDSMKYRVASGIARNLLGATVPASNSCRLFEYPIRLDKTIECSWLSGSNLSVKKSAFAKVGFEEQLEGYSLGEDVLFSRRLSAHGGLYITPLARCHHALSETGLPQRSTLAPVERDFLHSLFGLRGDLMYLNRRILFPIFGYSGS